MTTAALRPSRRPLARARQLNRPPRRFPRRRRSALPPPDATQGADPGRSIPQEVADAAMMDAEQILPAGWRPATNSPNTVPPMTPTGCHDLFARINAEEAAMAATASARRTYKAHVPGMVLGDVTVVVSIDSFVTPVRDFASSRELIERCPNFTTSAPNNDDGLQHWTLTEGTPPPLSFPACRVAFTLVGQSGVHRVVTLAWADTVLVGHNEATIQIFYSYQTDPPATVGPTLHQLECRLVRRRHPTTAPVTVHWRR